MGVTPTSGESTIGTHTARGWSSRQPERAQRPSQGLSCVLAGDLQQSQFLTFALRKLYIPSTKEMITCIIWNKMENQLPLDDPEELRYWPWYSKLWPVTLIRIDAWSWGTLLQFGPNECVDWWGSIHIGRWLILFGKAFYKPRQ